MTTQHDYKRKKHNGGSDRLSDLPDELLGHILSFLPTTAEAGRAAVLSRRYRHVFANVHTLSFHDTQDYNFWGDAYTFYLDSVERRSVNGDFIDHVNAALLCRRRCVGLALDASLRSFSVSFNYFYRWDVAMLQNWVSHALQQSSAQEFHLELRLHEEDNQCQQGRRYYDYGRTDSRSGWCFKFPRPLFSCAALRSLRVAHCQLNPPEDTFLPSLETLHLTAVLDSEEAIHLLIARCPRLDDMMLKSCSQLTRVYVPPDKRLARFSLLCCHNVVSVVLDVSRLRVLDYGGAVPADSLFTFHGGPSSSLRISSGTIDLMCGGLSSLSTAEELVRFCKLLGNYFVTAKHLHLVSWRLGCAIERSDFFPLFSRLHKLELTGCLDSHTSVYAVPRILQQTPNLEVLTLFLTPVPSKSDRLEYHLATIPQAHEVLCLRQRLREINLVHFQGTDDQTRLAELLLHNALLLQDLSVVFPKGSSLSLQTRLVNDIKKWMASKSTKITVTQQCDLALNKKINM